LTTAFTYHSYRDARAALSAAARAGKPVLLVTPPDAANHAGPEYLLEMYRAAHDDTPGVEASAVVDCGADAGTAMRALRCGWRDVVLTADTTTRTRLADMASQLGGALRRSRPETNDLIAAGDPDWTCRQAFGLEHDKKRRDGGSHDQRKP